MAELRIYERDTDALFIQAFRKSSSFAAGFARIVGLDLPNGSPMVQGQTKHLGYSGTIDIDATFPDGRRLLIENKIDSGYSVTRAGIGQPERYQASVDALAKLGIEAASVLLAPDIYLTATRHAGKFNHAVSYESLAHLFFDDELLLLRSAIHQAETPYEPQANVESVEFFSAYENFVYSRFSDLTMKRNPNAGGVRPKGSHTIYFDVPNTLVAHPGLPKPRMSIQCWDSGANSASVKIMIGQWGRSTGRLLAPESLADIGAYLRPAGRSLGIVVDTPRLDTQVGFNSQILEITEGLEAALRLQKWWNDNLEILGKGADEVDLIR